MQAKLSAVLIDDEEKSLLTISKQLEMYCPEIDVIGKYSDPLVGLEALRENPPDLLFLDIVMPRLRGIELARQLGNPNVDIVFVTAHNDFALDAIKLSAMDYLLKPIEDPQELREIVRKSISRKLQRDIYGRNHIQILEQLIENAQTERFNPDTRIRLADEDEILIVRVRDIVMLEAQRNYCMFYFQNGNKKLISKNLGHYITAFEPYHFVQISRSVLINPDHVVRIDRKNGGMLEMVNGQKLDISKSIKEILEMLGRKFD
jgi:two-component system, LytTR family, response regulator